VERLAAYSDLRKPESFASIDASAAGNVTLPPEGYAGAVWFNVLGTATAAALLMADVSWRRRAAA
jgi:hypothetical protein